MIPSNWKKKTSLATSTLRMEDTKIRSKNYNFWEEEDLE